MVDAASMRQEEQQILCPYCGKGKDGGKHSAGKGNEKGNASTVGIEALRVAALRKGLL